MTFSLTAPTKILFVSGLSGSGKSTALKILEDLGFDSIDNLPFGLLFSLLEQPLAQKVAIGIDIRTLVKGGQKDFSSSLATAQSPLTQPLIVQQILDCIQGLKESLPLTSVQILFFDSDDDTLLRRYEETRRRHPLVDLSLTESLERERQWMGLIKDKADIVIDTSRMSLPPLIRRLHNLFGPSAESLVERADLNELITFQVVSFSYRWGVPREADFVFDARFLVNPYYESALRLLTGKDPEVQDFLHKDKQLPPAFAAIQELLRVSLQGFSSSNRSYVTVAFGCTGGQHRSVFMAEKIGAWLQEYYKRVFIYHREF